MSPIGAMQFSQQGRNNTIRFEGWKRQPYRDSGGRWTLGVGHLLVPSDGIFPQEYYYWDSNRKIWDIKPGFVSTVESAQFTDGQVGEIFERDLADAETAIKRNVHVPLTQGQYDALMDFAHNIGETQFAASTLVKKLNNSDYEGAWQEFDRWIYDDGRVVAQLQTRRDAAQALFLT